MGLGSLANTMKLNVSRNSRSGHVNEGRDLDGDAVGKAVVDKGGRGAIHEFWRKCANSLNPTDDFATGLAESVANVFGEI